MDDNVTRKFGHCEECENEITDNCEEYYVDSDGKVFCSVECAMEHHGITKIEL